MFRMLPLAAMASLFALPALACAGFEVHDAYARSSGPTAQSGAAFMVIHNHSDAACHITAVRSDIAQRTELHTHSEDAQGVMRMIEIEGGIPLPPHAEHVMARGGDHVMFLGLTGPMEQGAMLPVTFVFQDGSERTVTIEVDHQRQPAAGHGHGHGHSHGHGG